MAQIKFKDIIHTNDEGFNLLLKNKYAYWVHYKYVVPMEQISFEEYLELERFGINEDCIDKKIGKYITKDGKFSFNVWSSDELLKYVDFGETEKLQSIDRFEKYNKTVGNLGPNITTEMIKDTRGYLMELFEKEIITDNYPNKELVVRMLQYFKNGAVDKEFTPVLIKINDLLNAGSLVNSQGLNGNPISSAGSVPNSGGSVCGCSNPNSGNITNFSNINAYRTQLTYDLVSEYHQGMLVLLDKVFGDPDLWILGCEVSTQLEIKEYIDGILKLQLNIPQFSQTFTKDLQDFSKTLEYLSEGRFVGNKNFIRDSITKFVKYIPFLKF